MRIQARESRVSSHRVLLWILGSLLFLAILLGWAKNLLPGADIDRLPIMCAFRRSTGIPCPGCGLTRSWVALAGGHLRQSLELHRLGWLVMFYVVLQLCRHGFWLLSTSWRKKIDQMGYWLDRALIFLALGLFVNWIFTLSMLP